MESAQGRGLVAGEPTRNGGLELLISTPDFLGGERDWRLNQLPVANHLIPQAYVIKASVKIQKDRVWRLSRLGNQNTSTYLHVPPCPQIHKN